MSSYPGVFDTKCVSDKKIECLSTDYCSQDLPNKDFNLTESKDFNLTENKNFNMTNSHQKSDEEAIKKMNVHSLDNNKLIDVHPYNPALTYKSCKKGSYDTPREILNNNYLTDELHTSHTWSNQRGYGHITVGTFDSCSNIHTKIHPYNRIDPLPVPHNGIVDDQFSPWNTNNVITKRK